MKTIITLLIIAAGLTWLFTAKRAVSLEITGSPGVTVSGYCLADGVRHEVAGTVPLRLEFSAKRSLSYCVMKTVDAGTLSAAFHCSTMSGSSTTQAKRGGVAGNVRLSALRILDRCALTTANEAGPNLKSPQPTAMLVTPRAGARVAPSTVVAGL